MNFVTSSMFTLSLFAFLFLACIIPSSATINCYKCFASIGDCQTGTCTTSGYCLSETTNTSSGFSVARSCLDITIGSNLGCKTATTSIGTTTTCLCNTNLCVGGSSLASGLKSSTVLLFSLVLVVYIAYIK